MRNIKRVGVINDLSGIGRCSLTVAIPIISALGSQCCPIPTAILSNQTEFEGFTFLDLTDELKNYTEAIEKLKVRFDCIYSGFLGSLKQIDLIKNYINKNRDSLIVIDPVMGDNGELYETFNDEISNKIKEIISFANIITPNITEACILSGIKYSKNKRKEEILEISRILGDMGPENIIITGVKIDNQFSNVYYNSVTEELFITKVNHINESYSGTGDLFTSILVGLILKNINIKKAIKIAGDFLYKVIEFTYEMKTNPKEGILFEPFLKELILIDEK